MDDFEVLCVIISQVVDLNEYDNIRIESGVLDAIFKFRHYFIDEVVRKDDKENLYKNKKIIDENTFLINEKSYQMQYFLGNFIDRGIGSSFRINGKSSVSLIDKTIQEIYHICKIVSKFINFMSFFSTDRKPEASRISLHTGDHLDAWVDTNDFKIDDYKVFSDLGLNYEPMKKKINKVIELLFNGIADNKKDTLFIDHLNFAFTISPSTERFMCQCRGFEYLFKRCEKQVKIKSLYEKLKFVNDKYSKFLSLRSFSTNDAELKKIKDLRNDIAHGDYCYSELQPQQGRFIYVLDNFLLVMNLRLIGFDETEIENIIKLCV